MDYLRFLSPLPGLWERVAEMAIGGIGYALLLAALIAFIGWRDRRWRLANGWRVDD